MKEKIFSFLVFAVIAVSVVNAQHDRELSAVILIAAFSIVMTFVKPSIKVPSTASFYFVILYGLTITLSYLLLTLHTSLNYRPLYHQYAGLLAFFAVVLFDIKLQQNFKKMVFIATLIIASQYILTYYNKYVFWNTVIGHQNSTGMLFAMVCPLIYDLLYSEKGKWAYGIGLVVIIFGIYVCGSRGALMAIVIMSIVYFIATKRYKTLAIGLSVLLLMGLIPTRGSSRLWSNLQHLSMGILSGRDTIWAGIVQFIIKHPVIGCGIGNAHLSCPASNTGTHSLYLSLHSFGGIFALVFWGFPVWSALRKRGYIDIKCAIGIYIIYAIFSEHAANTPPNNILFWLYMGILLQSNCKYREYLHPRIVFTGILLGACIWSWRHYQCNINLIAAYTTRNHLLAIGCADKILKTEPRNVKALYIRGIRCMRLGYFPEAYADFVAVKRLCPSWAENDKFLEYTRRII